MFNYPDFQASTEWLDKFKFCHGISQKCVSSESADVKEDDCVLETKCLAEIIAGTQR